MQIATPYPNNSRIVNGIVTVYNTDVVLNVNTSAVAATINLMDYVSGHFNTQYRLYIKDYSNNCATKNITIVAPAGFKINNSSTYVMNTNGASVEVIITSNVDYLAINTATSATGITNVTLANTVFVAKNGNDTTGLVERLDKPFLTFSAARAALLANFTPSATNRILIDAYPGSYNEGLILDNYVDYNLRDIVLELNSGVNATITDNNIACNSIISGSAIVRRTGTGATQAFRIQNSNSIVEFHYNSLYSSTGKAVDIAAGNVYMYGSTISGSLAATVSISGGNVVIKSNITSVDNGCVLISGGVLTIYGSISNIAGQSITNSGGTLYLYGNIDAASASRNVVCNAGSIFIIGNNSNSLSGCATLSGSSNYTITGDSTAGSSGSAHAYQLGTTGVVTINGNVICSATGAIPIDNNGAAIGGKIIINNSTIYSGAYIAISNLGSATLILNCCRVQAPTAAMDAIQKNFNSNLIINCSTLIAGAGAYSINSLSAEDVLIYGACQANLAPNSNTNLLVGTLVISSSVV